MGRAEWARPVVVLRLRLVVCEGSGPPTTWRKREKVVPSFWHPGSRHLFEGCPATRASGNSDQRMPSGGACPRSSRRSRFSRLMPRSNTNIWFVPKKGLVSAGGSFHAARPKSYCRHANIASNARPFCDDSELRKYRF